MTIEHIPHNDEPSDHKPNGHRARGFMPLPSMSVAAAVVGAAIIALTAGLFTVSSLALFTDTESVGSNTFTTGNVDLTTSPTSTAINMSGMVPGSLITAPLTVTNNGGAGGIEFRYAMESTTTENVLATELVLEIKDDVVGTCDDTTFAAGSSTIYSGVLGNTTPVQVIGDKTQGADTGDRVLANAASEMLCFQVRLPGTATNASMGLTSTATFEFIAEQTVNN